MEKEKTYEEKIEEINNTRVLCDLCGEPFRWGDGHNCKYPTFRRLDNIEREISNLWSTVSNVVDAVDRAKLIEMQETINYLSIVVDQLLRNVYISED